MTKKEIRAAQVNAIENAGTWLMEMDSFSELNDEEVEIHHEYGRLFRDHSEAIVKYLNRLFKNNIS